MLSENGSLLVGRNFNGEEMVEGITQGCTGSDCSETFLILLTWTCLQQQQVAQGTLRKFYKLFKAGTNKVGPCSFPFYQRQ